MLNNPDSRHHQDVHVTHVLSLRHKSEDNSSQLILAILRHCERATWGCESIDYNNQWPYSCYVSRPKHKYNILCFDFGIVALQSNMKYLAPRLSRFTKQISLSSPKFQHRYINILTSKMATPSQVHLTINDTGVVKHETQTEETARLTSQLLQENHKVPTALTRSLPLLTTLHRTITASSTTRDFTTTSPITSSRSMV